MRAPCPPYALIPVRLLSNFKGCIAALILTANVLFIATAMTPIAGFKLGLPFAWSRRLADRVLNALAQSWVRTNNAWIALMQRVRWEVSGVEGIDRHGWYLLSCNHQCWTDILVLQRVFSGRMPLLKFFIKRELFYVPVMGLAWWALDFPFMRRGSSATSRERDLAAVRDACSRFRLVPTALLNFLEGTRFSRIKQARQRSPYRHLLKPRLGGMAAALAALGDRVEALVDVTIVYPRGVPSFWDLLCGRLREVVVQVRRVTIPPELRGAADAAQLARLQTWMGELWAEKDRVIDEITRRREAQSV